MKYHWTDEMTVWLRDHYGKTPEQIENLDGDELDDFMEKITNDECNAANGDEKEADTIAAILDIVCEL